jgi:hypothetical protein
VIPVQPSTVVLTSRSPAALAASITQSASPRARERGYSRVGDSRRPVFAVTWPIVGWQRTAVMKCQAAIFDVDGVTRRAAVPYVALPALGLHDVTSLLGTGASLFVVVLAESSATTRACAARHNEMTSFDSDLVGLEAANGAAAFSSAFVVNVGATQTQMVDNAGGRPARPAHRHDCGRMIFAISAARPRAPRTAAGQAARQRPAGCIPATARKCTRDHRAHPAGAVARIPPSSPARMRSAADPRRRSPPQAGAR